MKHGLGLALVLVTALVFAGLGSADFINFDDGDYLYENPHLRSGLSAEVVAWSFRANYAENWHPLTWISHAIDLQFFGANAGAHHWVNVGFHCLNTWLLFLFLHATTRSQWCSGLVAALFALHPLHVESVAWISERKDVLSTSFWMLTLLAYMRYARAPSAGRYALVFLCLTLGLMAKPMLVTLPLVLLLMDFWPLGRLGLGTTQFRRRLLEKGPLLALSLASCFLTYWAQRGAGAVASLENYSLPLRISNALVSLARYLGKMLWPTDLAIFYPLPQFIPLWQTALATLLLALITWVALRASKRQPYCIVGWLWFLGTLVPVIGLVQVGKQAMADRYTYVPLIGLFIAVVWWSAERAHHWRLHRRWIAGAAGCVLLALAFQTWRQLQYWTDSFLLYEHALAVTEENFLVHTKLAEAQVRAGRVDEAVEHFEEALRIDPTFGYAHLNLGVALAQAGRGEESWPHLVEAVRLLPDLASAQANLAAALEHRGRIPEALERYEEALRLDEANASAHYNLSRVLLGIGRTDEAITHLRRAIRWDPGHVLAHNRLGVTLASGGDFEEGIAHFRRAVKLDPQNFRAVNNLATTLARRGDVDEAILYFREALRLQPDSTEVRENLRRALEQAGQ